MSVSANPLYTRSVPRGMVYRALAVYNYFLFFPLETITKLSESRLIEHLVGLYNRRCYFSPYIAHSPVILIFLSVWDCPFTLAHIFDIKGGLSEPLRDLNLNGSIIVSD